MRRKDREVTDFDEVIQILNNCKVLHLAMISKGKPYSVPVNFGYIVKEIDGIKKLFVYIHGAGEGKKIQALRENPNVSFCCEHNVETKSYDDSDNACSWTCFYNSVIGFGKAQFIENESEKTEGLDSIMIHNGYRIPAGIKKIAYNMMELAKTAVLKIEVELITGKRHK